MRRFALLTVLSLCGMPAAYAADSTLGPQTETVSERAGNPGWAFQVTPYMWAAGLEGSISPFRRGPTIDVDKSFSDVMDNLNFGGFVNLWARYDRFVFSGDVMYVDTTDSHASGPLSGFQIPGLGAAIPPGSTVDGKVDTKQFMATLQGGYRIVDTSNFTLDALAGARFWHISNGITVTASHFAIGSRTATHDENFGWIDPVVGLRAFLPVTDELSLQVQADVGGFGAGSDISWSALATANYRVTDNLSLSAGYKALKVDYDRDGHIYDTLLSGPVLGMTWRF